MSMVQPAAAIQPRPITSEAEYRAALARVAELENSDDLEVVGELEALANYIEAWEEKVWAAGRRAG